MAWFLEFPDEADNKSMKRMRVDESQPLRIGRGSNSDTKINDPAMSRVHCEITFEGSSPVLKDLGSSTGTFIGTRKIEKSVLTSGQAFVAGNTRFKLLSDSPLDAPTRMVSKSRTVQGRLDSLKEKLEKKKTLDRFELTRLINSSGQNLVYLAKDTQNDAEVAVKVLPIDGGTEEDEARFMRAMELLQSVRDPFLVRMIRAGRRKTYCWVAMEWLAAGSLADRVAKFGLNGCLEWRDAWRVVSCLAQSLHILEREKLVHRNIKPTSILYRESNNTYLLSDLVVAKATESDGKMVTRQIYLPSDLAYTAPERLSGTEENVNSLQSDIYSLGAVITELLIGEAPFGHGELRDLLPRLKNARSKVTVDKQIGMNELFVDLINTMTEPDPRKRFPTAYKLWQEVERVGKFAGFSAV